MIGQRCRGAALAAATLMTLTLAGACAHLPEPRGLGCFAAAADKPAASADGRTESVTLDVLTYNIEGLPWPARSGRGRQLRAIGEHLRRLREAGQAPDIVLFQEVFSRNAVRAVERTGYPGLIGGPSRTQRGARVADYSLPGKPKIAKGELGVRLLASGLAIASRYPIVGVATRPYSRRSCAGFDCLSNKGVLLARIAVPGAPTPVDVFTTHMNSQRSSRVSPQRHLASHNAQAAELNAFLQAQHSADRPVILGGDFNMRGSQARFETFRAFAPLELVHQRCMSAGSDCAVEMSWDGDEPWMDTQDLQLFAPGTQMALRPIRVSAMFDGAPGSPQLSDHDGFRVVYRLEWERKPQPGLSTPCGEYAAARR